jgi:hypothetical protein
MNRILKQLKIIVYICLLIFLTSCNRFIWNESVLSPIKKTSMFIVSDTYSDTINYYEVIDINNHKSMLNFINKKWFTDTIKYKIGDTLTFKK